MTEPHNSKPFLWALFLVFSVLWFYGLDLRSLVPTDEGRYAEMAREMVATGDWVTTRLNGVKYFEKPPLQIWMTALTFELFGLGEWQARFWTGLCGMLGIVLTALAGTKVFNPRVGFYAGLTLASCFYWASMGHINSLDMGLSGMMTAALCALLIAQRDDATAKERRNWMLLCWAGMALAVLSKGLIGVVLPGAVLVLYTVLTRDWAIWKRLHVGKGLLTFFAITTPWFVLVSLKNPEFAHFFFIHEHFERFLTKTHRREGPWHYFIPMLLVGIVPWLGMLAQSLWQSWRPSLEVAQPVFQAKKLLLIWAGFIFFFFSYSGSKLPSYILPIFPALALLVAAYMENATRKGMMLGAALVALLGALGLAFGSRLPAVASDAHDHTLYLAYLPWVLAAAAALLVGGVIGLWYARRLQRDLIVLALALAGFAGSYLMQLGFEPFGYDRSGKSLVPATLAELTPQTKIYAVGMYDQTLPFYLQRTTTLVAHRDELDFGLANDPSLWIENVDDFFKLWRDGPKALAIIRPGSYLEFQGKGLPMRLIAQDLRRVIITNDLKK